MRVLVVTDWPALPAGTERYVETLVGSLRRQGDTVRLLTSSAGDAAEGEADYVAYGTDQRAAQAVLQLVNPSAVLTLRRALREFRPAAVHLNMFLPHLSPAILAELRDVRTVLMIHDLKAVCPNGAKMRRDGTQCRSRAGFVCWRGGCLSTARYLRDRPRYGMFRSGLRYVECVRTISLAMQRELAQVGIDAELLTLPVPPPADGFAHRPASVPTFVYGGRLAPVKGVDVLLRAWARLRADRPEARLRIHGNGPDREATERLIDDLGVRDSVLVDPRMVAGWADSGLGDAWAVVAPSIFREPLGLVAIESVVRGVPVIASDTGGLAETVEHGRSGLLVPPGDEEALAAAMADVCAGRGLAHRSVPAGIVEAARRRHDPDAHARAMHRLLERPTAAGVPA